jgi:hypothetical protein
MWDVEWRGTHVCILQKATELRPFDLLKWLITGDNPFCYISLERLYVERLFLMTESIWVYDIE